MKILNREQIREADIFTIKNEPIKSIDLMERAATRFTSELLEWLKPDGSIYIFCGKGNNGGDGLVAARLLKMQRHSVVVCIVHYSDRSSDDFNTNFKRLPGDIPVIDIYSANDFPSECQGKMIIDALWGTGLTRPIKGFSREIIAGINKAGKTIVALDIPSGTYCDNINSDQARIRADYTITFLPNKLAFLIPENQDYIGNRRAVDIGLNHDFINSCVTNYTMVDKLDLLARFPRRKPFAHKGNFGHALIIGGSKGKAGAAVLAARAALRSGAGLVTAHIPACSYNILQTAVPECMVSVDTHSEIVTEVIPGENITAIGIGPGLGTDKKSLQALQNLIENANQPLVIDADGLNLLAQKKELLDKLPQGSILTPHIGEFTRLTKKCSDHIERLNVLREFCMKYKAVVVLKGRYSAICSPEGQVQFNPTGNPGMATGGSGDVLTGIITSFRAQGDSALNAAVKGVFLHGLAGDMAARKITEEALIAGDIINKLPAAFDSCR